MVQHLQTVLLEINATDWQQWPMTSTSCSTNFFCTIGILQQVHLQGVQHPEWASPRCNNKTGLQQFSTTSSTSTLRGTRTSCTTSSTTTSLIWSKDMNNKFDQNIWLQHWHRDLHRDHQDGHEEQQPWSTLKSHVHNNHRCSLQSFHRRGWHDKMQQQPQ